jgi:hypothetical protein
MKRTAEERRTGAKHSDMQTRCASTRTPRKVAEIRAPRVITMPIRDCKGRGRRRFRRCRVSPRTITP